MIQKWKQHCACRLAKDIDTSDYYPGLFVACGINDFLYFHPANVCFVDTLLDLGIDHEFLSTTGGHVITDEILQAGMYSLDSVMSDSIFTRTSELEPDKMVRSYNFPNPFITATTLSFRLFKPENVQFTVYNVQSQMVYTMEERREKGEQQFKWNADGLPAGIYYFRIQAGDKVGSGKMVKMD